MTGINVFVAQGFLLGLAMGTTCLATCGPVYGPFLLQRNRSVGGGLRALAEILAGRFMSYAVFGALAGTVGGKIALVHRPLFSFIGYGLSTAFLLTSVFVSFKRERSCAVSRWMGFASHPFLLGAITGINLCPSFLVALTKAVLLSGAWAGTIFFIFFFAGTSIYMLPLSAFGLVAHKRTFRVVGQVASILVAVWLAYSAIQIASEEL